MDTRIGTTILHFTLLEGSALTHLNLGKACCDSVMKVVAEKAVNLKYLNISGSVVTDQVCSPSSSQKKVAVFISFISFNFSTNPGHLLPVRS